MSERYTHGHHESVLRSHTWRTAENSAAYLLPHLAPGQHLLDVGCGPGTISLDLARRVAPGSVIGIDAASGVLAQAEAARLRAGVENVRFESGDVYHLTFDDASFDVVHAHQVLQHLTNPVRALTEMRRVLRPNGWLAVRDGDYAAFTWFPADARLDRWLALYHDITQRNQAEADAGRRLLGWVQAAEFTNPVATSSTWTFATPEDRAWWGESWADRVESSAFADQAVRYGLSDAGELAAIATAWREWTRHHDGVFIVVHGEVLAHR